MADLVHDYDWISAQDEELLCVQLSMAQIQIILSTANRFKWFARWHSPTGASIDYDWIEKQVDNLQSQIMFPGECQKMYEFRVNSPSAPIDPSFQDGHLYYRTVTEPPNNDWLDAGHVLPLPTVTRDETVTPKTTTLDLDYEGDDQPDLTTTWPDGIDGIDGEDANCISCDDWPQQVGAGSAQQKCDKAYAIVTMVRDYYTAMENIYDGSMTANVLAGNMALFSANYDAYKSYNAAELYITNDSIIDATLGNPAWVATMTCTLSCDDRISDDGALSPEDVQFIKEDLSAGASVVDFFLLRAFEGILLRSVANYVYQSAVIQPLNHDCSGCICSDWLVEFDFNNTSGSPQIIAEEPFRPGVPVGFYNLARWNHVDIELPPPSRWSRFLVLDAIPSTPGTFEIVHVSMDYTASKTSPLTIDIQLAAYTVYPYNSAYTGMNTLYYQSLPVAAHPNPVEWSGTLSNIKGIRFGLYIDGGKPSPAALLGTGIIHKVRIAGMGTNPFT